MVSCIISSEAKEISKTSFLSLSKVKSVQRELSSDQIISSVFKISVVRGHPCGLDTAHTPNFGSSYTTLQEISFLQGRQKVVKLGMTFWMSHGMTFWMSHEFDNDTTVPISKIHCLFSR